MSKFPPFDNPLVGYTEHRTDLPGGRAANVFTMRACVVKADGTGRREMAPQLVANANSWTQFAGWSPDGRQAIIGAGWESDDDAAWEDEHKEFHGIAQIGRPGRIRGGDALPGRA